MCDFFKLSDCRVFLKAVLNLNVDERFDSTQIQLSGWASMQPITRPRGFAQQKYTIENCLPQLLHGTRPSTPIPCEESGCPMVLTSPYPLMQPIGGVHTLHHPHASTGSHIVTMHVQQQPTDSVRHHHHPHTVRQAYTQTPPDSVLEHTSVMSTGQTYNPQVIQGVNPQLHSHGQQVGGHTTYMPAKRPLVAKIGAAGRRIADAVKQVGHHSRGHSAANSRHGSAGSSKSIVS